MVRRRTPRHVPDVPPRRFRVVEDQSSSSDSRHVEGVGRPDNCLLTGAIEVCMDRGRSSPVPQIGPLAGQYRDAVWSARGAVHMPYMLFPRESLRRFTASEARGETRRASNRLRSWPRTRQDARTTGSAGQATAWLQVSGADLVSRLERSGLAARGLTPARAFEPSLHEGHLFPAGGSYPGGATRRRSAAGLQVRVLQITAGRASPLRAEGAGPAAGVRPLLRERSFEPSPQVCPRATCSAAVALPPLRGFKRSGRVRGQDPQSVIGTPSSSQTAWRLMRRIRSSTWSYSRRSWCSRREIFCTA
jgi:hypothetical protein